MDKISSLFKPLTCFMALLLAAFVAGCGGGGDGAPFQFGGTSDPVGAACSGTAAACVPLLTAGDFVILAQTAITDVPTSAITGNVGLAGGASIAGLTCAEVTGSIIDSDAGYDGEGGPTTCLTTNGPRLSLALTDITAAFADADDTVAHPNTGGIDPDPTQGPIAAGVYDFTGSIAISTPVTLSGSATDVWIFRVPAGNVTQTTGNVLLTGGALPQNVFWRVAGTVAINAGEFAGIVLADNTISMGSGATVNGRLYSATDVTLIANTVTRP